MMQASTSDISTNELSLKREMFDQLNYLVEMLTVDQTRALLEQVQSLIDKFDQSGAEADSLNTLSKREMEVLVLVANGYNRRDIGLTLGISANTAARHISNMYGKLGISTVAEATGLAYRTLLIGNYWLASGNSQRSN